MYVWIRILWILFRIWKMHVWISRLINHAWRWATNVCIPLFLSDACAVLDDVCADSVTDEIFSVWDDVCVDSRLLRVFSASDFSRGFPSLIIDSVATSTVCGIRWIRQRYVTAECERPKLTASDKIYKFGDSRQFVSIGSVILDGFSL